MKRVVVTGMGLLTSIGNNKKTSWITLSTKKSGIKKLITLMFQTYLQKCRIH